MGWDLQPGGHFKDVYRVAPITDWEDVDLTLWGSASDVTPDHTSELFFEGDWKFPLKQKYDAVNTVVSGTYEDKRNTEDCPPMPKVFNVECDTPQAHKPAHAANTLRAKYRAAIGRPVARARKGASNV